MDRCEEVNLVPTGKQRLEKLAHHCLDERGIAYARSSTWASLASSVLGKDYGKDKCRAIEDLQEWAKGRELPHGYESKPVKGKGKKYFYSSWEWKKLRFEVIKMYGSTCMCCGSNDRIVVDHIKPRKKFPALELDKNNLQVLCNSCNIAKSNHDYTDFRGCENG